MKYFKNKIILISIFIVSLFLPSCSDFLDIVPDNVATIEYAFRMRSTAERYLFTCYSYLPDAADPRRYPTMWGADEGWIEYVYQQSHTGPWHIAAGLQNANNPILAPWTGSNSAPDLWEAISQCNIFLENVRLVPDLETHEMVEWIAEVKFLKAFYHFELLKHYGPIPIARENIPISASIEEVSVFREPVDDVFDYIVELLDEAVTDLPDWVMDENSQLGRITKPIAMGIKAKVLVYAASPLFNGNPDYRNFTNKDGTPLFSSEYSAEKWQIAADACKEAIDKAHNLGYELYEFRPSGQALNISEESAIQMTIRGKLTEKWNTEILWANTKSTTDYLQKWTAPLGLDESQRLYTGSNGSYGATLNTAYMFYTENGLPINQDITWDYANRLELRTATDEDRYKIKTGYETVGLHFDREPRFYGSLGFDGSIWYGNGKYSGSNLYWLEMKRGQFLGKTREGWHPYGAYFIKKFVNYTNTATSRTVYSTELWPWVMLRLGDLYLLYAEALNELHGPNAESIFYLNEIRDKAGIPDMETAWDNFSTSPGKYNTQVGLREIIQTERKIEMMFEGQRFWDLRRWKTAPLELNSPILGWDIGQELAEQYYREIPLHSQTFTLKDYFWPIRELDLIINENLVQNPGWE